MKFDEYAETTLEGIERFSNGYNDIATGVLYGMLFGFTIFLLILLFPFYFLGKITHKKKKKVKK